MSIPERNLVKRMAAQVRIDLVFVGLMVLTFVMMSSNCSLVSPVKLEQSESLKPVDQSSLRRLDLVYGVF